MRDRTITPVKGSMPVEPHRTGGLQMAECQLTEKCIFFNDRMSHMPGMAEIYKDRYCRDDHDMCARYMVFKALGRENVPFDLFPNERDRALEVIG